MVGNVLLVVVGLIVGAPVSTIAVRVVTATILPSVARVGGFEGVGNGFVEGSSVIVGGIGVGRGVVVNGGIVVVRYWRWRLELRLLLRGLLVVC